MPCSSIPTLACWVAANLSPELRALASARPLSHAFAIRIGESRAFVKAALGFKGNESMNSEKSSLRELTSLMERKKMVVPRRNRHEGVGRARTIFGNTYD